MNPQAKRAARQQKNALCCGAAALAGVGAVAWFALRSAPAPLALAQSNVAAARAARQPARALASRPSTPAQKIVAGAKSQQGTLYSPAYFDIAYPNGDVPRERGACTDVVVRALRRAGCDLQRLMHQDMKRHFGLYPRKWGARRTDTNIDHRRVPNQMVFFGRHGSTLTREVSARTLPQWQPGDIVCWKLDNQLDHIGIVSDTRNARGVPLVIHNLAVCAEEDRLTAWKIQGHFRFPKAR